MQQKLIFCYLIVIVLVLSGCTVQTKNSNIQTKREDGAYFCNKDSDCMIKDVRNCCGYYPKCVNKDYIPDIEAVERECREKGVASICGFPEIKECKCVQNKCESIEGEVVV